MPRPPSVLIIGAGFAGIGLGMLLRRAGIRSFTILEKAQSLGGTWRDNTYPGAACDVPSYLYCFSFGPRPAWSRKWAPQSEILQYLTDLADESGVTDHIRFCVEVDRAAWHDATRQWVVTAADGRTIRADILVSAVGQLHRPHMPAIPGMESFAGRLFHSARWPVDLDLTGRRVGVLGTAASAVQIVPAIVTEAQHVTVFQRSPNWILPRSDRAYRVWEQRAFAWFPGAARAHRLWIWANHEARFPTLRGRWPFVPLARRMLQRHLAETIPDAGLRRRLTPDYPIGARRVLSADAYYPALTRPDVDLVTEPIAHIEPPGIRLSGGRSIPLDVVVLATGFRSTEFLAPMQVTGRGGRELHEDWRDGARAFLGLSVPGYPNFFMMYGPNTNLGHNSILFMLECQARHIVACVARMEHGDEVEVRPDVFDAFDARLQTDLRRTVWGDVGRSWYKDESGRITNNWASGTPRYWWLTRRSPSYAYDRRRASTGHPRGA